MCIDGQPCGICAKAINDILDKAGWDAKRAAALTGVPIEIVTKLTQGDIGVPADDLNRLIAGAVKADQVELQEEL